MFRLLFLLGIFCLAISCNDNNTNTSTPTTPKQITPAPPPQPVGEQLYPSVPGEVIKYLWDNCTGVDYIFYNFNFSMNRAEQNDIRNSLIHIGNQTALIQKSCKPLGRIMFKDDDGIKLEADLFFSKGCTYFIFMENNKPVQANFMSDEGVKFFQNVFSRMNIPTQ